MKWISEVEALFQRATEDVQLTDLRRLFAAGPAQLQAQTEQITLLEEELESHQRVYDAMATASLADTPLGPLREALVEVESRLRSSGDEAAALHALMAPAFETLSQVEEYALDLEDGVKMVYESMEDEDSQHVGSPTRSILDPGDSCVEDGADRCESPTDSTVESEQNESAVREAECLLHQEAVVVEAAKQEVAGLKLEIEQAEQRRDDLQQALVEQKVRWSEEAQGMQGKIWDLEKRLATEQEERKAKLASLEVEAVNLRREVAVRKQTASQTHLARQDLMACVCLFQTPVVAGFMVVLVGLFTDELSLCFGFLMLLVVALSLATVLIARSSKPGVLKVSVMVSEHISELYGSGGVATSGLARVVASVKQICTSFL